MKILFLLSFLILITACSSSKKKEEIKPALTPAPVQQVMTVHPQNFSPEELKRLELLDYYRRLREEAEAQKKVPQKTKKKGKKNNRVKRLDDDTRIVPKSINTPTSASITNVANDELRIQLEQHMAFFCIKFESRFSRPTDCRAYTENVLKDCQDKKQSQPSLNLVQCLKKNM